MEKKRIRKRKRSKVQEEKRRILLNQILNKWVYYSFQYDDETHYIACFHRLAEEGAVSKIEQVILSGDDLQDGLYHITDYDIDLIYDNKEKKEMIEFIPKKFDLFIGKYAEKRHSTESVEELRERLVERNFLSPDEFDLFLQSQKKPLHLEEIKLSFPQFD